MKNIIQVITHFDLGGAERVAINIAKSANHKEFKHYIISIQKTDSEYSETLKADLEKEGIEYYSSPIKATKLAICLFSFWFIPIYLKIKPNIIHSHTEIPDVSLFLFRKIAWIFWKIRPKYIRTIHNTQLWNNWKMLGSIIEKYYIKNKSNIAISNSTKTNYENAYHDKQIPIVYNGLEETIQKEFPNINKEKINILFAGRLEDQKGIKELISVFSAFKNNNYFHFYIIGNGSYKNLIKSSFNDYDNVFIFEKIYGLSQYIGSFDYLFMPSKHEGLALMPIEASLAHTPSIINHCPGLTETLPPNWPLAVNNNSINEFIKLINQCIDNKNYKILAQKAYLYAKDNFSIERMQQKYAKIYMKL